jgi:peptidoglycan hydrolase CwlO-like protein
MFVRTSWRARMRPRVLLAVLAVAAVAGFVAAAASLAPTTAAADTKTDLNQTQKQLKDIEAVLRDARADAAKVAAAAESADEAVAAAKSRLDAARRREAMAGADRAQAESMLAATRADLKRNQNALAEQARNAYMTGGGMSNLAALIDAQDLTVLADRAITLNYVAAQGSDTIGQLEVARQRDAMTRTQMVSIEQDRADATAAVTAELNDLRKVQEVRQRAKRALDAKIAKLANQAASLRAHSAELRKLIQQEEAAQARAAATPPPPVQPSPSAPTTSLSAGSIAVINGICDLSSTSAAERWIIMHESGGDPTADNPTSTAFGLGQLLLGNRVLYLGSNYATTDCALQLSAFRSYVRDRYGTAEAAQAFWEANGWY